MMNRLSTRILKHVAAQPEGTPIYAKALLHLGKRAAVDQALSRLARRGRLYRVGRGLYVGPVESRFGVHPPGSSRVLNAMAELMGETIVPHGAASANLLGLTTQVPVREIYLTSGPTRRLAFGKLIVELRHAPRWQLALSGRVSGMALRALAWFGREEGREGMRQIAKRIPREALIEMAGARARLPTWMAEQISRALQRA